MELGYESPLFGVQAIYDNAKDATKLNNNGAAGAPYPGGAVGVTFLNESTSMLLARFTPFEALTFKAGFEHQELKNPSNPTVDAATTSIYSYPVAAVNVNPYGTGPKPKINVYWFGGTYAITPAFKVSLGYYRGHQQDFSTSNANGQLGNKSGNDNYYSVMLEYALSKRTNFYLANMENTKTGGFRNGVNGTTIGASTGIGAWDTFGVGLRHMF